MSAEIKIGGCLTQRLNEHQVLTAVIRDALNWVDEAVRVADIAETVEDPICRRLRTVQQELRQIQVDVAAGAHVEDRPMPEVLEERIRDQRLPGDG